MQIKIEIDVKPEELRRFLGLPDVAGLQEDVINFLREKVSDANENFDPAAFVKGNIDTLRKNKAWQRFMYGTGEDDGDSSAPTTGTSRKSRKRRSPRKSGADD